MTNFIHSGALGDIIYSLNFVKNILPEGDKCNYYLKNILSHDNINYFEMAKSLLLSQPFIKEVIPFLPSTPLYQTPVELKTTENIVNLDLFRLHLGSWENHLIKLYYISSSKELPKNWKDPWLSLEIDQKDEEDYVVVNRTNRYNNPSINWKNKLKEIKNKYNKVYFIGLEYEYELFCSNFGEVEYIKTENLLEMARLIKGAKKCYINQSLCLTLCQGFGVDYELELEPRHEKLVRLYTKNEIIMKENFNA